jgi:large repetitive protein
MGSELSTLNGRSRIRYRGFFLVDRLKLTGFNPGGTGAWHSAVVYRKVIQ